MSHPIKRFTHWVIWDIPATDKIAKAIPSGKIISSPEGAVQGIGYGFHRYAGPKPPKGKSHRYCFTIYAFDCKISLKSSSTKRKVLSKVACYAAEVNLTDTYNFYYANMDGYYKESEIKYYYGFTMNKMKKNARTPMLIFLKGSRKNTKSMDMPAQILVGRMRKILFVQSG